MKRALACVVVGAAFVVMAPQVALAAPEGFTYYSRGTTMTPRFQWNANGGYCGETSFISAGMHYGQYTSQWTARAVASPGVAQTKVKSQLLLGAGENDLRAARAMKLNAARFDSGHQRSVAQYLTWVKDKYLKGHVVIMGVLNNVRTLNEPLPGDSVYDHIVPVLGIGSSRPLNAYAQDYLASDDITISDNGLHDIGPNIPYLYTYRFDQFPLSRAAANRNGGPVYSLRDRPQNYATQVTGIIDPDHVTIPIRLTSNVNGEGVQDQEYLRSAPPATAITLTAHVSVPRSDRAYNVYLYDDFAKVPTRNFNANAADAIRSWVIPAGTTGTWTTTIHVMSNQTMVFRAVPVSAP